jgi:hypothetical protein
MSSILAKLFHYVLLTTAKHGIDESHGLSHSMNVLHFAHQIYESEVRESPLLEEQRHIIFTAAVLHDVCDKKYVSEKEGLAEIGEFLDNMDLMSSPGSRPIGVGLPSEPNIHFPAYNPEEIRAVQDIISTMSYSTVKKHGYPKLRHYQKAYHIVREADLLAAYDFDRSMIYHMHVNNRDVKTAFLSAEDLFETRVFQHNRDGLFLHDVSKRLSFDLHQGAKLRMEAWRSIIRNPVF